MRLLFLFLSFFFADTISAQVPALFKYQGLARTTGGTPLSNQNISLRISIHKTTMGGGIVYRETQAVITNPFGAFNINIGGGTVVSGNFSTIAWGHDAYFQETEMDIAGGTNYISMGTSQLLSVPYARAADSALNGIAPFIVQNTTGGNDLTAVAIAAIANTGANEAPALYAKNNGLGTSIYAESGNGIFILGDSSGLETNGNSLLGGNVKINDSLHVSGPLSVTGNTSLNNLALAGTLSAPIINAAQLHVTGAFTSGGQTLNGDLQVNGNLGVSGVVGSLNGTIINGTQGSFSTSLTTNGLQVFGDQEIIGNLAVSGNVGALTGTLINGTQASFSTSTTTGHLVVNGSGVVNGDLNVTGVLSKGAGSFKIDHPLDPANKFLYHSFVESPDMKNIYDGNVTTDANGNATILLPSYFEALNKDFRYQLTVIGQFAQVIISEEISNNSFKIKSDKPNVKVSWQVTGIRKDAFAEKHRIIPEVEKTEEEKGKYIYPDLHQKLNSD